MRRQIRDSWTMTSSKAPTPFRCLQNIPSIKNENVMHTRKMSKGGVKCFECKLKFANKDKFNEHHCRGPGAYICNFCHRSYYQFKRLVNHIQIHLKINNELKYTCDICCKTFRKLKTLKIHILSIHQGIEYRCKDCSNIFLCKKDLEKHSCKDNIETKCTECDLMLSNKERRMHNRAHKHCFKCKYCCYNFVSRCKYEEHISKMNCSKSARKTWLKNYNQAQCRSCKLDCCNEENLLKHFKNSHTGMPFECHVCKEDFNSFVSLKSHMECHLKQKFCCGECGNEYVSKEGFRKHMMKHDVYRFPCKFCSKGFSFERNFSKHVRKCKLNPANSSGYVQRRQTKWESTIIKTKIRQPEEVFKVEKIESSLFDDDEASPLSNRKGWFDSYYENDTSNDVNADYFFDVDADVGGPPSPSESEVSNSSKSSGDSIKEDYEYNHKYCRLCDTTFPLEYELLHHFCKVHPGEMPHKCPNCEKEVSLFAQLREHLKEHGVGLGIYNCCNCSKAFRSETRLKVHYDKCSGVVDSQPLVDTCKTCGKTYQTKCGYKRHKRICKAKKKAKKISRVKSTSDVVISDTECNDNNLEDAVEYADDEVTVAQKTAESGAGQIKNGVMKSELLISVDCTPSQRPMTPPPSTLPSSEKEPEPCTEKPAEWRCRLCEATFPYERGIVIHFKEKHPEEKPLVCHVCGMHLADKYKEHLKTHGMGEEYHCELCGKRFNQKFLSKIHELWHKGIEYKCDLCKQKFLNEEKMKKHVDSGKCKNRESLLRLPCDVCGRLYRSKYGLKCHYATHTPKEERDVKRKMNCEFCGKWFTTNNGLVRHRRIHTGEKPYCCHFCPKTFTQETNCKIHERTHTGEMQPRKKKPNLTIVPELPSSAFQSHQAVYEFIAVPLNPEKIKGDG